MKRVALQICAAMFLTVAARANTALPIVSQASLEACLYNNIVILQNSPVTGTFTLNGVSGTGSFQSQVAGFSPNPPNSTLTAYHYTMDVSAMSHAGNHCVRLIMHFGTPDGCNGPAVGGSAGQFQSATLSQYGDVTFLFAGGCLNPGQPAVSFEMLSSANSYQTNLVTIIDDYTDLASGQTNETVLNVPALLPAVPPNFPPWVYAPQPPRFPNPFFQGYFGTNQYLPPTNGFGAYDFQVQLFDAPSNGLAVTPVFTVPVQVNNGLFNMALPFDAVAMCDGSARWLSIAVRPTGGSGGFTQLSPLLPLTPAPQAIYAFSAGTVAAIAPNQAVTSLNNITGNLNLVPGNGINITYSGPTITISAQSGAPSDKNIKTDFAPVSSENILTKLSGLPISSWRYTNEAPGIRHVGPMAQDFRSTFGLGHDDKLIEYVDEQGVALTAIQALNQKVQEQRAELKQKQTEIDALKERLDKVEQLLKR